MAKKNSGASSSSQVKGKNGPPYVKNNKTEVGGKASSKDIKKVEKKKEDKNDHSHVTLLAHPIVTLKVLAILLGRLCKASVSFVLSHLPLIIGICSLIAAF
jgi:hypothetical protein